MIVSLSCWLESLRVDCSPAALLWKDLNAVSGITYISVVCTEVLNFPSPCYRVSIA